MNRCRFFIILAVSMLGAIFFVGENRLALAGYDSLPKAHVWVKAEGKFTVIAPDDEKLNRVFMVKGWKERRVRGDEQIAFDAAILISREYRMIRILFPVLDEVSCVDYDYDVPRIRKEIARCFDRARKKLENKRTEEMKKRSAPSRGLKLSKVSEKMYGEWIHLIYEIPFGYSPDESKAEILWCLGI